MLILPTEALLKLFISPNLLNLKINLRKGHCQGPGTDTSSQTHELVTWEVMAGSYFSFCCKFKHPTEMTAVQTVASHFQWWRWWRWPPIRSAVPCSLNHSSRKPTPRSGSVALPQILWTTQFYFAQSFLWRINQSQLLLSANNNPFWYAQQWHMPPFCDPTFSLQYLPVSDLSVYCLTLTLEWNLHEVKVICFVHC